MARQIELEVPAGLDGERLDKVVASLLDLSRSQASLVAQAGVTVDGIDAGASDRVAAGAVIRCVPPEASPALEPEPVEFEVLYEDEAMLVVDKPAEVVVHPGAGQARGTLAAGLLHRFPELEGVGDAGRWGLVHRLDRETSGAIVVGRTHQAFALLRAQLAEREMRRIYTAIVEGRMEAATGTVDAPIARDPARPTRRAVVAGEDRHAPTTRSSVTSRRSITVFSRSAWRRGAPIRSGSTCPRSGTRWPAIAATAPLVSPSRASACTRPESSWITR
jgi:23S rRNA pseudouridine1911/1915/1917 synthase